MSNKIDGFGQRPAEVSGGNRASGTERAGDRSRPVDSSPSSDRLTLTDSARQLQRLSEAVANAPDTDAARVDALRQAVARGEYQADSARIASRMVALERDLAGR